MDKALRVLLTVVVMMNYLNLSVQAVEEDTEIGYYYIYQLEDAENIALTAVKHEFDEDVSVVDKVNKLFALLIQLKYNENQMTLFPDDAQFKGAIFREGVLEIEFSKELLNYGGTAWEEGLVKQIIYTVFSLDEIEELTVFY